MYYHFLKQRKKGGPCTELAGFTRLVSSPEARADGLQDEIPSIFVRQYTRAELSPFKYYPVLNRPYAIVQWIASGGLEGIQEAYIWMAETDHVLIRPLPNLATASGPAAFIFDYMYASRTHQPIIDRVAPGIRYADVDPVGPSPVILSKPTLSRVAPGWLNISRRLKLDRDADRQFDWVLEMWGYSIAAAAMGVRHELVPHFQCEGNMGGTIHTAYLHHYTHSIDYTVRAADGGFFFWSLNKRQYDTYYPPRDLEPPPDGASEEAFWLLDAWNEASGNLSTWPSSPTANGTIFRPARDDDSMTNAMMMLCGAGDACLDERNWSLHRRANIARA